MAGKKIITHSELQTFKDCPQKWEYRYVIGWRKKIVAPSTLFGSAFHRALECRYLGRSTEEALNAVHAVFRDYLDRHADDIEDPVPYMQMRDVTKEVFLNYLAHWEGRDLKIASDPVTGDPLVEVEFRIPVFTPSGRASRFFVLAGKVDAVVEHDGELWVLEHKTRDKITEDSFKRLVLDQQTRAYCYAMQVYLGRRIAGVVYNLVRRKAPGKPQINKDGTVSARKTDTTADVLCETLLKQDEFLCSLPPEERRKRKLAPGIDFDKYAGEIARLRSVLFFARHFQRYDDEDYKAVQMEIYQVSLMMRRTRWIYRNDAACDHWGGCAYRPVCMGLEPEGQYVLAKTEHTELEGRVLHPPLGRGYAVESDRTPVVGIDGILEAVNA